MKRIVLFRHAKSDRTGVYASDHDRPLNARGAHAARVMGRFLTRSGNVPGAALTSSALRARSTLDLAMEAGGWRCPVRASPVLYESGPAGVLEEIHAETDRAGSLLVVGHEPTWSELAADLIGGGSLVMVTATLAAIDFDGNTWESIGPGRGSLAWMVPPRLFTDGTLDL